MLCVACVLSATESRGWESERCSEMSAFSFSAGFSPERCNLISFLFFPLSKYIIFGFETNSRYR